jgi:hypothetical protein
VIHLADWLASDHDLAERLELIDNLCRALGEFHAREPHVRPALDPASVGLTPELAVTLSPSDPRESGEQVPEYRAPETVAGAPYDPSADTYSVAVLCYEILAGRHPLVLATPLGAIEAAADVPPPPLAQVRPDLPRDLAEAIMPCLERDPEWRPRDLSYLVETLHKARRTVPPARRRRAPVKPPAVKPAAAEAHAEAPLSARSVSAQSRLPLIATAVVGLGAVLGGLWYLTQPQPAPAPVQVARRAGDAAAGPSAPSPDAAAAQAAESVTAAADPRPAPTGVAAETAAPVAASAPPTAAPATRSDPDATPPREAPTPQPAATPAPAATTAAPPAREATRVAVATAPPTTLAPRFEPPRAEEPAARPEPAPPAHPAVVTALVPARLRRGATVLVDVRGSDLRADLQPRILFKGREAAAGVQPVGQRLVDPTWLKVMLKIDAQAREGSYTLSLGDARGNVSNARTFEIGR